MRGRLPFIIALFCFVAWLSYLGYLASRYAFPVVVSRSQFMLTTQVAEAQLIFENGQPVRAKVNRFVGKTPESDRIVEFEFDDWTFAKINGVGQVNPDSTYIDELSRAKLINNQQITKDRRYFLPLKKMSDKLYQLVAPPNSPGLSNVPERPRIYPVTPEVEAQIRMLLPDAPEIEKQ